MPGAGQGGSGRVCCPARADRLGRGLLGFLVDPVGRLGRDLGGGFRVLGHLLGRIVSLLERGSGGLGLDQSLIQAGLGVHRVRHGFESDGHVLLGLLQVLHARLAGQILRIGGGLSFLAGRSVGVGKIRVGLLHGHPQRDGRGFGLLGGLHRRIVVGLRLRFRTVGGFRGGRLRIIGGRSCGAQGKHQANPDWRHQGQEPAPGREGRNIGFDAVFHGLVRVDAKHSVEVPEPRGPQGMDGESAHQTGQTDQGTPSSQRTSLWISVARSRREKPTSPRRHIGRDRVSQARGDLLRRDRASGRRTGRNEIPHCRGHGEAEG